MIKTIKKAIRKKIAEYIFSIINDHDWYSNLKLFKQVRNDLLRSKNSANSLYDKLSRLEKEIFILKPVIGIDYGFAAPGVIVVAQSINGFERCSIIPMAAGKTTQEYRDIVLMLKDQYGVPSTRVYADMPLRTPNCVKEKVKGNEHY